MWTQPSHYYFWSRLRKLDGRPKLAFYELRHACATMLLERGIRPWDVSQQLGHTDGGALVMTRYGHPAEADARSRLLAAWNDPPTPQPAVSGAIRSTCRESARKSGRLQPI